MNLVNMLTRRDPLKRAFVTLEDGMTDILNEEFMLPPEPGSSPDDGMADLYGGDLYPGSIDDNDRTDATSRTEERADRVTAHTKSRLASHAAFDEARTKVNHDLERIGEALGNIVAKQNITREFLDDCYADIHRANELEVANGAYAADNRRLNERVEKLEKLRTRYDQLIDVLKRREIKLLEESEALREQLGSLKLEVVEARNIVTRHESQFGELQVSLAAKTGEAERFMRDAEVLRERNVGLTIDLDGAQKRQAETRRKLEELSTIQASDSARLSEVTGRLASEENETARLQKLSDQLEARLLESSESVARLSSELMERDKRYLSENQALKADIQALQGRLQAATSEQREAGIEVNDLRARLSDVESEKLILEKKFAALGSEFENERRLYISQAGLQAPQESIAAELHRKQADQMRNEIGILQETVKQLRQHEKAQANARARAKAEADVASTFSVANGKIVPEFARPAQLARSA